MYSKNTYKIIAVIIMIFLCMTAFWLSKEKKEITDDIEKNDVSEKNSGYFEDIYAVLNDGEKLKLFVKETEAYFLLPSYAAEAVLEYDENKYVISMSGQKVPSGSLIDENAAAIEINNEKHSFTMVRSSNMPSLYIATSDGDVKRIDSDKDETDIGNIRVVKENGEIEFSDGLDLIKTRGNSSFQADKKTYRIKLSHKQSLLGLASDRSFILQANAYDSTNMRNAVAYELAKEMGIPYVTDFRYADVYLNGEYRGNYIVLQPVSVGKNHVDIKRDGSYLFETVHRENRIDPGARYFLVGSEVFFEIHYPEKISEQEFTYLQKHINRIDQLISDLKPEESLEELSRYIDMKSFADIYIMDFITNDIDCGNYSSYGYIDGQDGLIHLGPVWDYDKAWGNEKKRNGRYEFQSYDSRWPQLLAENLEFQKIINNRMSDISSVIEYIQSDYIDSMKLYLEPSLMVDDIRNDLPTRQSVDEGSFGGNIEQLRSYLKARYELLLDFSHNRDNYVRVYIDSAVGPCFILNMGESLSDEQLDFVKVLKGCKKIETEKGEEVNSEFSFCKDMVVYAK